MIKAKAIEPLKGAMAKLIEEARTAKEAIPNAETIQKTQEQKEKVDILAEKAVNLVKGLEPLFRDDLAKIQEIVKAADGALHGFLDKVSASAIAAAKSLGSPLGSLKLARQPEADAQRRLEEAEENIYGL